MTKHEGLVERNISILGNEQPKRIWLMAYSHAGDVCWSSNPNPDDADEIEAVEYVRADEIERLSASLAAMEKREEELAERLVDCAASLAAAAQSQAEERK